MELKYDEKSCGVLIFRHATKSQSEDHKANSINGMNLYLLLHYPSGHWDLPKGHVEPGESEHQTAARELLEETGIADFQFIEGFREAISYKYKRDRKISNKEVVFFLAKTDLEQIKLSHEHHHFKWLPYAPAFNKLTFDNARNILKKAVAFLANEPLKK
mgnify:CR=1 FL=1